MTHTKATRPHPRAHLLGAALFLLLPLTHTALAQSLPYADVTPEHWAYDAVAELSTLGIVTGYPDGRFDGTRAATRYEIALIAARVLETAREQGSGAPAADTETRLGTLERALAGAASLAYTERLETRVQALEVALNTQSGTQRFPATRDDGGDTSALSAAGAVASPATATTTPTRTLRLSRRPPHPFYVGISPGLISTAGDVYLSLQGGYDGLVGPVGPTLRLTFNGSNRELRLALDALGKVELPLENLRLYAGLGLGTTVRPVGASMLLEAPFGGEYDITENVGLFLQLITSYGFSPVNDVGAEVSTGINLRF